MKCYLFPIRFRFIFLFFSVEDFNENQQKQLNSYIQGIGGIDIRLWRVKKERRKKVDKLTTHRI